MQRLPAPAALSAGRLSVAEMVAAQGNMRKFWNMCCRAGDRDVAYGVYKGAGRCGPWCITLNPLIFTPSDELSEVLLRWGTTVSTANCSAAAACTFDERAVAQQKSAPFLAARACGGPTCIAGASRLTLPWGVRVGGQRPHVVGGAQVD